MRHVDDPNVHVFRGWGQKSEMLRQQMFFTDMRKSLIINSPIPRVTMVNKQSAVTVTASFLSKNLMFAWEPLSDAFKL